MQLPLWRQLMYLSTVLIWIHRLMQEELVQFPLKLILWKMIGLLVYNSLRVKLTGNRIFLIVVSKSEKLFFFGVPGTIRVLPE